MGLLLVEVGRGGQAYRRQVVEAAVVGLATRYEDVKTVLADPRFSRAAAVGRDEPRTRPHAAGPNTIMSYDPPEHSRLRRLVTQAFTVRRVEALRARAPQIADELVDAMLAKGPPADLFADFGLPLPTMVICELLGVPAEDRATFRTWADAFLSTTKYTPEQVRTYATTCSPHWSPPATTTTGSPKRNC